MNKTVIANAIWDEALNRKVKAFCSSETVKHLVDDAIYNKLVTSIDVQWLRERGYLTEVESVLVKIPLFKYSDGTSISFVNIKCDSHIVKPKEVKQSHSANIYNRTGRPELYSNTIELDGNSAVVYEKIFKSVGSCHLKDLKDVISQCSTYQEVENIFPDFAVAIRSFDSGKEKIFVKSKLIMEILSEKY